MISAIQGKILEIDFTNVTLMTSWGVAYKIHINENTFGKISMQEEIFLHIYHHFTQDAQSLFGFLESREKLLFIELLKISGIGGKAGQSLLSMGYETLVRAIAMNDVFSILEVKGIGSKTAEKIILEMKDKDIIKTSYGESMREKNQPKNVLDDALYNEILKTLVSLGYNEKSVEKILRNLPEGLHSAEKIIPYVIKHMG